MNISNPIHTNHTKHNSVKSRHHRLSKRLLRKLLSNQESLALKTNCKFDPEDQSTNFDGVKLATENSVIGETW